MIKRASHSPGLFVGLIVLLAVAASPSAQPVSSDTTIAIDEAVQRQADIVELRHKLSEAKNAETGKDLILAARLYEDAYTLVKRIGPGVEAEAQQTVARLTAVRMELAHSAQKRGDLQGAERQVNDVLNVDPRNAEALDFKKGNEKMMAEQRGTVISPAAQERIPAINNEKIDAATLVRDGRLFYEMGKLDEAEAKLNHALQIDAQVPGAAYYLDLIKEARFREAAARREIDSKDKVVQVEQAWETPVERELLPVPNPYARGNLVYTSKGRQIIVSKLDRIPIDSAGFDGLPLSEVVRWLSEEAKKRDPEKRGINFIINPNAETGGPTAASTAIDPTTGLPVAGAAPESADINAVTIKINPPITSVRLADVLDAIVRVADRPIKYLHRRLRGGLLLEGTRIATALHSNIQN